MNRILPHIIALCLLISVPLVSHAASLDPIEDANESLRQKVEKAMLDGADEHGIDILSDGIVFASRDDGMVANTGIDGFGSLTGNDLASGVVVGFTYISGFGLPPGFYRVYVKIPLHSRKGIAELLDSSDQTVLTTPAVLGRRASTTDKFTVSVDERSITVDYHNGVVGIKVGIPIR